MPSPDALAAAMARGVAGLRLAVMPESEREGVEDEVLAAFDESVARLAALGAHVETVALPESFQELGARTGEIIGVEGYHFVGDLVDDATLPVDDDVRPRIGIGRDMQAHRYYQRLREQRSVREAYEAALTGFDALLTPGTKTVAPPVASIDQTGTAAGFTRPFNFIEWCALALPNGLSSQGLPLSLQIACRGGDEAMALRIGAAFQADTDWHQRHPGLTPP